MLPNLYPDDDLQPQSPETSDAKFVAHYSPSESQLALSEGFRRLIALGLRENNPHILPYNLRVDPPRVIIPKLDKIHQAPTGKLGDE